MKIGLTGGIGSGKSTITKYLEDMGYSIVDADVIARQVLEPGTEALRKVAKIFGEQAIDEHGALDRAGLGKIVFADKKKLDMLNCIVQGKIQEEIKKQLSRQEENSKQSHGSKQEAANRRAESFVFLDAALLLENKIDKLVDEVWLVVAPIEDRIERIARRDGISREEILNRINNQWSDDEKRKRAHVIIENIGGKEELYEQVKTLLSRSGDCKYKKQKD